MLTRLMLLFIFLPFLCWSQQVNKSDFFREGAVRYDFEFVGDFQTVDIVHRQTKFLSHWGGNYNSLIDSFNFGTYHYKVFDAQTGQVIFSKGFSPLFWEWKDTSEALKRKRSFYHSLYFPKPVNNVTIKLYSRNEDNSWGECYIDTVFIDDYFIINEQAAGWEIDTLQYYGEPSKKIDLVILAEGYTYNEMDKFLHDATLLTDSLFNAQPFTHYRLSFNIFLVKAVSVESGTDIPGEGIYRNTAFNSSFYTFDSPRYLTTSDMKSVYDAVDGLAWDQLYLLVNHDGYGGGGFYNSLNISSSNNILSPFVFIHEFGHGFAALADEYYTPSTSVDDFHPLNIEPWEANITTLVNFEAKWKLMIDEDVPVPTPRNNTYQNRVGVFEGGGYREKGIYSPVMSCWMKEATAGEFCPVCQKAIEKVILTNTK